MTSIRQQMKAIPPKSRPLAQLVIAALNAGQHLNSAPEIPNTPERQRLIQEILRRVPDDDLSEELVGRLADGVLNGYYTEASLFDAIKKIDEGVKTYRETNGVRGKENYWYPLQGWLMKRYQQNNIEWTACDAKPIQRAPRPANIRKITSHGREFYYDFDRDCEVE